jgi:hypothetical protein
MKRIAALLVAPANSLREEGGGVQHAARQYQNVLQNAGFDLRLFPYEFDRRVRRRITRRLFPSVSSAEFPPNQIEPVILALQEHSAKFVFFGFHIDEALSARIRAVAPTVQQVLLSQGIESIDFCVAQRARRPDGCPTNTSRASGMLGQQLLRDSRLRRLIDATMTLSPLEVEMEQWLGTPRAIWVPQAIVERPLDHMPIDGRAGCVSTLNHPPNYDGIVRLLDALSLMNPTGLRFRLVGSPATVGQELQGRFKFVDFLGPLSDRELRAEAATWCCFVHPMFLYAKGCSTKVAIALGWRLPLATTKFGVRGYEWNSEVLPVSESPAQLAAEVVKRSSKENFRGFQGEAERMVELMPTVGELAARAATFLLNRPENAQPGETET